MTRCPVIDEGVKVWLVTWEWMGEHAKHPGEKIAAILNPRLSVTTVQELVAFLYANASYTLFERLRYALDPRRAAYPATREGLTVHCGHNPFLLARLVDDFELEPDGPTQAPPSWRERKRVRVLSEKPALKGE